VSPTPWIPARSLKNWAFLNVETGKFRNRLSCSLAFPLRPSYHFCMAAQPEQPSILSFEKLAP